MNVSKSQCYEFRHNIMNLGNQNSKYSWRIRDLENPQTGTQFANSVLMYKIGLGYYHLEFLHTPFLPKQRTKQSTAIILTLLHSYFRQQKSSNIPNISTTKKKKTKKNDRGS